MKKKFSLALIAAGLLCALAVVPAVSSAVYFNTVVADRLENTARETVSFYLSQYADSTTELLDTLRDGLYFLMSDESTLRIMHQTGPADYQERLAVEEGLSRAFVMGGRQAHSTITGIYLFKDRTQYLSVLRNGIYAGTASRVLSVYERYGGYNSARELYTHPDYPGYCYYVVDFVDLPSMQAVGKIIIELDGMALLSAAPLSAIYPQSVVLLRDLQGNVLNGGDDLFALAAETQDAAYVLADGVRYYHAGRTLSPFHARIDILVPAAEIFATPQEATELYIVFTLAVLLLTLAAGGGALYLLYKPLRQMLHKIDRLATGELTVRMGETPYRETERLAAAFNNMADRLEDLFGEVYEKGLLLRDAEFDLLESQIRPHFIFNILELINMRCLEAGQTGICRTVSNLAQLLRANIVHRHAQTITFEEELRYVTYYLELQKERFGDSLDYAVELEDASLLQTYLPKLTIQPLVENSIVHGLENKRGGGTVHVSIWEEADGVCIRVSDDGVGFDAAALDLNAPPAQPGERHNHVALANVHRRIQLLYGKEYGLRVDAAPGRGANILISLPSGTERRKEAH